MFVPGFSVTALSDDELSAKSHEIARAVVMASRQSVSYEAIEQLQNMQAAINAERYDRAMRDSFEQRQALFPKVIETEPDLRAPVEVAKDKQKVQRPMRQRSKQFGGLSMRRSPTPSTDLDTDPPKDTEE